VEGRLQLNPLLCGEPFAEYDGELSLGGGPFAWRHLPLAADLEIYPYLLRGKTIDQSNRVWSADTRTFRGAGFRIWLRSSIGQHGTTRRVLSLRLSNT
jgi:hypothetical protein